MSLSGPAKLLTIYTGETVQWKGKALYQALVMKLKQNGIAGATAIRGIEGYGARKQLHVAKLLDLSVDLPVIVEAVDTEEKIRNILPLVQEMVTQGLITLSDVEIIPHGKC